MSWFIVGAFLETAEDCFLVLNTGQYELMAQWQAGELGVAIRGIRQLPGDLRRPKRCTKQSKRRVANCESCETPFGDRPRTVHIWDGKVRYELCDQCHYRFLGDAETRKPRPFQEAMNELSKRLVERVAMEDFDFHTKIVGVTRKNDDGTSRQGLILGLKVGDFVVLEHQPSDRFPEAVAVYEATRQYQLGFVPAETAWDIAKGMEQGKFYGACVSALTGGREGARTRGVNLGIMIEW